MATDQATGYHLLYRTKQGTAEVFLDIVKLVMQEVMQYNKKLTTIRSDYEANERTPAVNQYFAANQISHEVSAPYKQHQNAVERTMQTAIKAISTMMLSQQWLRKDLWGAAARHWSFIDNSIPNYRSSSSPLQLMTGAHVDSRYQFQHAFGDLVIHSNTKEQRLWKFNARNELGTYVGDQQGAKDASYVYNLYDHSIKLRGATKRVYLSDYQLLHWYAKVVNEYENKKPLKLVEDAQYDFTSSIFDNPSEDQQLLTHFRLQQSTTSDPQHHQTKPIRNQHHYLPRDQQINQVSSVEKDSKSINSATTNLGTMQLQEGTTTTNNNRIALLTHYKKKKPQKSTEPTVAQALKSPQSTQWREALIKEVLSHMPGQMHSLEPITKQQ
jgi:hypothetical protein